MSDRLSAVGDLSDSLGSMASQMQEIRENIVPRSAYVALLQRIAGLETSYMHEDIHLDDSHSGYTDLDDLPSEAWEEESDQSD